jgi:hypothetical protein
MAIRPLSDADQLLTERFRCPEGIANFMVAPNLSSDSGYFRIGRNTVCYGQCSCENLTVSATNALHVPTQHVRRDASTVQLPFDPVQVVDNLRFERYVGKATRGKTFIVASNLLRSTYYAVRPFMPVPVRKPLQQMYLRGWDKIPFPMWPVDRTVENIFEQLLVLAMRSRNLNRVPFIWFWPDGARSCVILTHDVETLAGANFCRQLMDLNDSFGIKSSFQIVPEKRYPVPQAFLESIRKRGFEVNVHDLNHDGQLFSDLGEFLRRAQQIKRYAQEFGTLGFRSAVLYRNVDWYDALDFSYDMSIPSVAHLDPQRGGCCTVLPFFVGNMLELPVTTTQDYSLFHILKDYSTQLWRRQISLIREKHGLISLIVHPDYIIADAARRVYSELLSYLSELRHRRESWIALPREVAVWWTLRSKLNLINAEGTWRIEGKGSERARIAYAVLVNDTLTYEIDGDCAQGRN